MQNVHTSGQRGLSRDLNQCPALHRPLYPPANWYSRCSWDATAAPYLRGCDLNTEECCFVAGVLYAYMKLNTCCFKRTKCRRNQKEGGKCRVAGICGSVDVLSFTSFAGLRQKAGARQREPASLLRHHVNPPKPHLFYSDVSITSLTCIMNHEWN